MNMRQLFEIAKYESDAVSPALRPHLEKGIIDALGRNSTDARLTMVMKHAAIGVWLVFTVITCCIAIAAALKLVSVDREWLNLIWGGSAVGFLGVVSGVVRSHWTKE